jgi:hypothetical protein
MARYNCVIQIRANSSKVQVQSRFQANPDMWERMGIRAIRGQARSELGGGGTASDLSTNSLTISGYTKKQPATICCLIDRTPFPAI